MNGRQHIIALLGIPVISWLSACPMVRIEGEKSDFCMTYTPKSMKYSHWTLQPIQWRGVENNDVSDYEKMWE